MSLSQQTFAAYPHSRLRRLFRYSTVLLTTALLRCGSTVFLHSQNGLLTEKNKKLPLARHVVSALQHFYLVEYFIFIVFMRTQKVVVSNPKGKVIVGAVDVIKAVCVAVRSFIGTVEPLDHLFEWTVFCGNSILVGKSNDLSDLECKSIPKLLCEFHGGKRIGAVTVSDELKVFGQLSKSPKCHAHSKNAGANTTVIRYLVADDGTGCGIHDKPDVCLEAADFYVGFISSKDIPFFVGIQVNKGPDADGGGLTVVGDLLVGDADVIQVFKSLGGFAQGQPKIDMEGQTQGHDMRVMLTEFQRRGILGKGI